jgi:hypothetical protein
VAFYNAKRNQERRLQKVSWFVRVQVIYLPGCSRYTRAARRSFVIKNK